MMKTLPLSHLLPAAPPATIACRSRPPLQRGNDHPHNPPPLTLNRSTRESRRKSLQLSNSSRISGRKMCGDGYLTLGGVCVWLGVSAAEVVLGVPPQRGGGPAAGHVEGREAIV